MMVFLGTKALSKAYEASSGQHRKDSLSNVHYGFKECSKVCNKYYNPNEGAKIIVHCLIL